MKCKIILNLKNCSKTTIVEKIFPSSNFGLVGYGGLGNWGVLGGKCVFGNNT